MIKKILFVMVVISLVATTCFARISASKIALGGLRPGVTLEYAESIYGKAKNIPISSPSKAAPKFIYQFGESFYCWPGFVILHSDANNGVSTPDGITVGSSDSEMVSKYGQPDNISPNPTAGHLGFEAYDYIATYYAAESYWVTGKPNSNRDISFLQIKFYVKYGKIIYIEISNLP